MGVRNIAPSSLRNLCHLRSLKSTRSLSRRWNWRIENLKEGEAIIRKREYDRRQEELREKEELRKKKAARETQMCSASKGVL